MKPPASLLCTLIALTFPAAALAQVPATQEEPSHRTTGMEGDGSGPRTARVKPLDIPEADSPLQTIDTQAVDGKAVRAFWRKPKGDGPFPAIVFIHGGLTQLQEDVLRGQLKSNPVITRLLGAGYAVAQATFRTYEKDVQSRGPIEDVRAVVHALSKIPSVDANRIALYGGSGGGNIALELGSDPLVHAVVAGEPATVLYTGMLTTGDYGPRLEIMASPEQYLTAELRERTLEKLQSLRSPVLILHSDQHDLHKLNGPLFVPLMKQAGVKVDYREYPGFGHGFYFGGGDDRWGKGADEQVVKQVIRDVQAFLEQDKHLNKPQTEPTNQLGWVLPEVNAPRVQRVLFDSQSAGQQVSFYLFTPEPYDRQPERRFPVLYWLHGGGGSTPAAAAQMARRYAEAMRTGKIPPMLIVFPNGLPMGMWCDWKDGTVKLETMLIKELIPYIDRSYRTLAQREGRIIEGFSMGGYGAARLGFKYPQLFAAVSLFGAGPLQLDFTDAPRVGPKGRDQVMDTAFGGDTAYFQEQSPWRLAEQNADPLRSGLLIRQIIGDRDETLRFNRDFKQHLDALKIPHHYRQLPGIPHNPNQVLDTLGEDNWAFYQQALGVLGAAAKD